MSWIIVLAKVLALGLAAWCVVYVWLVLFNLHRSQDRRRLPPAYSAALVLVLIATSLNVCLDIVAFQPVLSGLVSNLEFSGGYVLMRLLARSVMISAGLLFCCASRPRM